MGMARSEGERERERKESADTRYGIGEIKDVCNRNRFAKRFVYVLILSLFKYLCA